MKKWKIKGTIKELLSAPKINLPLKIYQQNWDEKSKYFLVQGVLYDYAYGYIYTNEEKTYFEENLEAHTIWYTQDIPLTAISYYFWTDSHRIHTETIGDFYNIEFKKYIHVEIEKIGFSHRLTKYLLQGNIKTISQLLQISFEDLAKIKNLGEKSIGEVKNFCEKLKLESNQLSADFSNSSTELTIKNSVIFENIFQISQGDFSFLENISLNNNEKEIIEKYRSSISIIGEDFAKKCLYASTTVKKIMLGLSAYIIDAKSHQYVKELAPFIPQNMLKKQIQGYIKAYTSDAKVQTNLMGFWDNPMDTVDSILRTNKTIKEEDYALLQRFFEWCAFDVAKEVNLICNKLFSDQRVQNIIDLRATGKTLEDVGKLLGLSRERIRQIEKDTKRKFNNLDIRHKLT